MPARLAGLQARLQSGLGGGKRAVAGIAAQAGRGPGDENLACAARRHDPRGFAHGHEPGEAGHFPDLAEHPVGGVQQWELHVRADVENHQRQRGDCFRFGQKRGDIVRLARIKRAPGDSPAQQRGQFVTIAASGVNGKALSGKLAHDGGADVVARAQHRDRLGRRGHLRSSAITATVKRDRQTSFPPSSSIRMVQTCVVRPIDSARAVA